MPIGNWQSRQGRSTVGREGAKLAREAGREGANLGCEGEGTKLARESGREGAKLARESCEGAKLARESESQVAREKAPTEINSRETWPWEGLGRWRAPALVEKRRGRGRLAERGRRLAQGGHVEVPRDVRRLAEKDDGAPRVAAAAAIGERARTCVLRPGFPAHCAGRGTFGDGAEKWRRQSSAWAGSRAARPR
jgi:hypothetical protein